MHLHRLTRRQALRTGAAALAVGALRPRSAFAASQPALFELPVEDGSGAAAAGWRTSRVLRAPRRFDMLGLRWSAGGVRAQVRTRRNGGSWSPWLPLHAVGEHAPDGATRVRATEPAYTGEADLLQLRLHGHASGLRARFVRAQPAARGAARASAAQAPKATRTQQPAILPRSAWGGDLVPPRRDPSFGQVQVAFVHHTVGRNDYAPEESAGIVLGIARFHRDSNGWDDIGYNFLVDQYGQVFEGRAGGIDQAVVGAQAQGYNAWSTGIALLGTHEQVGASPAALEAIARLIGWKLSRHGVPVLGTATVTSNGGASNRYPEGTPVTLERICGHRDGDKTSCPGAALYAQLPELRQRATRHVTPVGTIALRADSGTTLRPSRPLILSGWVRRRDGSIRAGGTVAVEYQTAGSAWTPLARAAADGNGTWRAEVVLPDSGTVRAVHTEEHIVSPLLSVRVLPRLTLVPDARRVTAGAAFAVRGEYAPVIARRSATVVVERVSGRGYKRVARQALTVRDGRYGVRLRLRTPGVYRITVAVGGTVTRRLVRVVSGTGGAGSR